MTGIWTPIFDEEFSGTSLNTSIWTSGWFGTGVSGPINDTETACYDSAQVSVPGDGFLHLHLVQQQEMCKGSNRPYTGSIISSNPADGVAGHTGFQFTYGYIEARIFFPSAPDGSVANWPGLMTTGQNWPTTGENDIAEGLGGQIQYHFHSPSGAPGGSAGGNYAGGWHTFGADWEAGVVTYYHDGIQIGQITSGITSAPMFIVINNSQGQYGGATVVPADMLVKYIRIWQRV